jgi:hypothetical protein
MTETTNTTKNQKAKTVVAKDQLTVDALRAQLFLDEATGYFYALKDGVAYKKGDFVGSVNIVTGLYKLQLFGTLYSGKDLAFFYTNGSWNPELAPRRGRAASGEAKVKEVKVHVPRTPPVITPEAIEAAKAEAAAKKAALKAKKEAAAAEAGQATA